MMKNYTWESVDVVYVYANESTTTSIGTLIPKSEDYGKSTATQTGDIDVAGGYTYLRDGFSSVGG